MKAIITVLGKDKVGIISGVSNALSNMNINILDISQTIMNDMFTMIMQVDTAKANVEFSKIAEKIKTELLARLITSINTPEYIETVEIGEEDITIKLKR